MSSGSQFLEELGDAASDFSLLFLRPLDTRPRAHALSDFDVTLPASIAHRTVGISLGAAPRSWGNCPVSRPSLCLLSIAFRFRHRSRTFECRYMRTVGAFGLPSRCSTSANTPLPEASRLSPCNRSDFWFRRRYVPGWRRSHRTAGLSSSSPDPAVVVLLAGPKGTGEG